MIIVKCSGGLGNQMFQYALYLELRGRGYNVALDTDDYGEENPRGFALAEAFGIEYARHRLPAPIRFLWNSYALMGGKAVRKAASLATIRYESGMPKFTDKLALGLDSIVIGESALFEGYWQSSSYFPSVQNELRDAYTFRKPSDPAALRVLEEIEGCDSVSVHIRRGDYEDNTRFREIYGGICTEAYYRKAAEFILAHTNAPRFFIFSDDIERVRESPYLGCFGDTKVFIAAKGPSWLDMQLMSRCKHNIVANSSYSWWASWLNDNRGKIVIAPSRWVNEDKARDLSDLSGIYENNWTIIEGNAHE